MTDVPVEAERSSRNAVLVGSADYLRNDPDSTRSGYRTGSGTCRRSAGSSDRDASSRLAATRTRVDVGPTIYFYRCRVSAGLSPQLSLSPS